MLYYYGLSMTWEIDTKSLREIFRFSLGNYTAGIFQMAPLIIPVMIVNAVGAREGAYYYIAHTLAMLFFTVPAGVSLSLFVEGSHEMPLRESSIKSLKFAVLILIPAIAVVFLFGDKLLLVFGTQVLSAGSRTVVVARGIQSLIGNPFDLFVDFDRSEKNKDAQLRELCTIGVDARSRISASFEVWNNWNGICMGTIVCIGVYSCSLVGGMEGTMVIGHQLWKTLKMGSKKGLVRPSMEVWTY